jgi:hypothetical protein
MCFGSYNAKEKGKKKEERNMKKEKKKKLNLALQVK